MLDDIDFGKVDLSKYPGEVQVAIKFARAMRGHLAADCALAAVKVLAFCAHTTGKSPQEVFKQTENMYWREIDDLKNSGIPSSAERKAGVASNDTGTVH